MADETDNRTGNVSASQTVAKKAANRAAAAKAYVVAMKKAGEEVPERVKMLAKMADETGTSPTWGSAGQLVSKKAANRAAAAKVYVAAMKRAGEEVPPWVKKLAKQAS